MKAKYKVRFNLGKGINFMKWKVSDPLGKATYYDPGKVLITMNGCRLINHKGTAKKIHEGANKTVCAWVECDSVEVSNDYIFSSNGEQVCYNPRVTPHWTLNDYIVDRAQFDKLITVGKSVRVA